MQRIQFSYEPTDLNPDMDDSSNMDHYRCTLSVQRAVGQSLNMDTMTRSMTIMFSKGSGHNGEPPTLEELLDCLASQASSVQLDAEFGEPELSFEEWADEYGYDHDSRRAEHTYKACVQQSRDLWHLLGEDDFNAIVYETARL